MSWILGLRSRFRQIIMRSEAESRADEEIGFHIEMETERNVREGMSPQEARQRAVAAFGGVETHREELRDERRIPVIEDLLQDVRFAARGLRRSPAFTAVAVLTLALGIGATTAIFSVVNGVLLRPLGFADPDRVVVLTEYNVKTGGERGTISLPNLGDLRDQSEVFEHLAAYRGWGATLAGDLPERVIAASVTSPFFDVLGVAPGRGRFFRPEDDEPGHPPVVVLTHGLWQRRFGGDPAVVGSSISVSGSSYEVIGVTPEGFEDPHLEGATEAPPELWRATPEGFLDAPRDGRSYAGIGRLRAGVSQAQAEGIAARVFRTLAEEYPAENGNFGVELIPVGDLLVGKLRTALFILLGVVGLVLLIACANVANLLLGRAASRQREMALRQALGAGRGRLTRLLLTESGVLALLGGGAGAILASFGLRMLLTLGEGSIPRADGIVMDGRVLGFALVVTLIASVLFGTLPALHATRRKPVATLVRASRGAQADRGGRRVRRGLIVGEVALSLILLAGAGLLIKSFLRLQQVETGVSDSGVLTFALSPSPETWPDSTGQLDLFYRELLPALGSLPGVLSVGSINILPMSGRNTCEGFQRDDVPPLPGGRRPCTEVRTTAGELFSTLGMRTLRGRSLGPADVAGGAPSVVINETMARTYWGSEDPIGKRMTFHRKSFEVVGVASDVRDFGPQRPAAPVTYVPFSQEPLAFMRRTQTLVLRTEGETLALAGAVRSVVREMDPVLPVEDLRTIRDVVDATVAQPRFRTVLVALFAALALALTAVGLYGVLSFQIALRTQEIGIRVALGARASDVVRMVTGEALTLALVGIGFGVAGALALTRVLRSLLFEVSPTDPAIFAAVTIFLCALSLLAAYVPARRATRVDPMVALRSE
jgi:predicted permease